MEEWEELLHPGSLPRSYPTFPHNATPVAHIAPLFLPKTVRAAKNRCTERCYDGCTRAPSRTSLLQARVHEPNLGSHLRAGRRGPYDRLAPLSGLRKELSLSPARIRLPRRLHGFAATLLAAALLGSVLSGCGSSGSSNSSAAPAAVIPASAPLYLEAVLQPSGSLKSETVSAAQRISRSKTPFASLLDVLAGSTGKAPDFAREVKPWLGTHGAVFLSSLTAGGSATQSGLAKSLGQALAGSGLGALASKAVESLLGGGSAQGGPVHTHSPSKKG